MDLTAQIVAAGCGATLLRSAQWVQPIQAACDQYEIDTPLRLAAFMAQIGVESGRLLYTREIWGPTSAQTGYEGRKDLGNTQPGDGKRFMGRGLIQITGRHNYTVAAAALNLDLLNHPELLEQPNDAALSAAWWWSSHGLNALADAGDFQIITRRINGGLTAYSERLQLYGCAKKALDLA
jgi:putative chitinase